MNVGITETVEDRYNTDLYFASPGDAVERGNDHQYDIFVAGEDMSPGMGVMLYSDGSVHIPYHDTADHYEVIGVVGCYDNRKPDSDTGKIIYKEGEPVQVGVRGTFWCMMGNDEHYQGPYSYGTQVSYDALSSSWSPHSFVPLASPVISGSVLTDQIRWAYNLPLRESLSTGAYRVRIDNKRFSINVDSSDRDDLADELLSVLRTGGYSELETDDGASSEYVKFLGTNVFDGYRNPARLVSTSGTQSGSLGMVSFSGLQR